MRFLYWARSINLRKVVNLFITKKPNNTEQKILNNRNVWNDYSLAQDDKKTQL